MMKDLKMGLRLLRYGYGCKGSMFAALLYICLGLIYSLLGNHLGNASWMESYMILCTAIFFVQVIFSLNAIKLVQSSAWSRRLSLIVPTLLGAVSILVLYLFVVLLKLWQVGMGQKTSGMVSFELLMSAAFIVMMLMYSGSAYKLFGLSTVLFGGSVLGLIVASNLLVHLPQLQDIPLWCGILSGFVGIILGGFLQYALSRLCYRLPVSRYAQIASLRKYL